MITKPLIYITYNSAHHVLMYNLLEIDLVYAFCKQITLYYVEKRGNKCFKCFSMFSLLGCHLTLAFMLKNLIRTLL